MSLSLFVNGVLAYYLKGPDVPTAGLHCLEGGSHTMVYWMVFPKRDPAPEDPEKRERPPRG